MKSRLPPLPSNEIIEALLEYKKIFIAIGWFTAFINIAMLAPAIYMMQVYDRVLASRNDVTLLMLSLILVGLLMFMAFLEHMRTMMVIRAGAKIDDHLNQRVYTAAFEQNLKKEGINAGQALNDLTTIRQFVTGSSVFAFFEVPWFPIYLGLIFFFNFWLGLFALVGIGTLFFLAWLNEFISHKPLNEANNLAVQSSQMTTNNLRNAEVIEAMGMLSNLRKRWFKTHKEFLNLQSQASQKAGVITSITKSVRVAIQSLILGLAALLVIDGYVSAGMMIAASVLIGRATAPVEQIIGIWKQWRSVVSSYHRLTTLLGNNPKREIGMSLPAPLGKLQVDAVRGAPPGSQILVLKGVSLSLDPGDALGIIGPSGSGKSTLARLLVGVWPALSGSVRLDGVEVYQWNKEELGSSIGYLPQDIELFSGTISENIARFNEIDSERVVRAAKLAGVHDLILRMPEGYDTVIGDAGQGLSGGQKQRIGLARALYGDPTFIVLDEPNSNLDEVGESALAQAILDLRKSKKTVVVISHRHPVIRVTNKLLVLNDGTVSAFGPTVKVIEELSRARKEAELKSSTANIGNGGGDEPA
jgi:ATP-binding cassette subfamily C exporter for protease/lipase